jgi:hypothetical protein
MYSPVAAAPTLSGTSAEIDRFLMQQYGPYGGLDVQLGAMVFFFGNCGKSIIAFNFSLLVLQQP